jgi:ATP-binding cassette subfamily F protein 3
MPAGKARDYLARFLFTGDDVLKRVAVLSGGERGRLALAKLALQGANLLLLDEPTNHLDIPAQEVLEAVLADYEGTILLISHDRYLIDALATQIWSLQDGRLTAFNGGYAEWAAQQEEARKQQAAEAAERKRRVPAARAPNGPEARQAASAARRRAQRAAELEAIIAGLERRLNELETELEAAGSAVDRVRTLGEEYAQVEADLGRRLSEWTALAEH